MDYVKFFGLECEPFQNDLDGRFYFEGSSQRRARLHLLRAVQQRKGLALLLGGPGLGKTTLAHQLLRDLAPQKVAAHLLVSSHRECARGWLLPQLARAYGVARPAARIPELIEQIHEQLLDVALAGRHPVLFVDEAQLLGERETLEEFRALLNLAHDGQRVFSMLLFGMEELGGAMALEASLAQRIDVRVQLAAFSPAETGAYLAHRLGRAGGSAGLLRRDAVDALYLYSGGVLRVLNTLADNALFEAALAESRSVGADHVAAAAQQLDLRPSAAPNPQAEAPPGEASASFQMMSSDAAAAPGSPGPRAPEPTERAEPDLAAEDEPLFGENTEETLGNMGKTEDWLEPVAPVLDLVMRSFDEQAAELAPPEPRSEAQPRPPNGGAAEAPADDPLEWSLLDLGADAGQDEAHAAPGAGELATAHGIPADDSMADLSDDLAAPHTELDEIDLESALEELVLDEPAPPVPATARSRGPRIDLPEDDDLDSLFDDIQIDG